MKEKRHFTKSKWVLISWTGLSRVFGLIRDILTASVFGTTAVADAFMVAFSIPNLFRNLFGEGAAGIAFVPYFSEVKNKEGDSAAFRLAQTVITLLAVVLAAISVIGFFICWTLAEMGEGVLVCRLSAVMIPYLFFICLVGFLGKLLNCLGKFGAPASLPVIFNLSWIASVVFICPLLGGPLDRQAFGLAAGVLLGGALQLGMQSMFLLRAGFNFKPRWELKNPALGLIFRKMMPTILAMAVLQINTLSDKFLAKLFLPSGSVASLFFANRLVQFPLGVFGVAMATAALPLLAKLWAQEKKKEFKDTLVHALCSGMLIAFPATVGLILLRDPIVRLIFEWGRFGEVSTRVTASILIWYAAGLIFFIWVKIITQAFYALKRHEVPAWSGGIAVVINLGLNLMVVFIPYLKRNLGVGGLALSTSISYLINTLVLLWIFKTKVGLPPGLGKFLLKCLAATLVFGTACFGLGQVPALTEAGNGLWVRLAQVIIPGGVGMGLFLLVLRLLGVDLKEYLPRKAGKQAEN